jgi:dihydroorotate dehydrogenase
VVKLSPDLAEDDTPAIIEVLVARGIDGIAISNTTLARIGLSDTSLASEAGGVSGRPLFHRSTTLLARVYQLTRGQVPLIGIGGIDSVSTAIAKMEAGATLLQLYTGLVFEGPGLIARLKRGLAAHIDRQRLAGIQAIVGRRAPEWAAKPLDGF